MSRIRAGRSGGQTELRPARTADGAMPKRTTAAFGKSELARRLLDIASRDYDSSAALAQAYLELACEVLRVPEAALHSGGPQTWRWNHQTSTISASSHGRLEPGFAVPFQRRNGSSGALVFPGTSMLATGQADSAELV